MRYYKIAIIVALLVACGKKMRPLEKPFSSLPELAEYHLRCIETNDGACLNARLLTFTEFHRSVYSELPEAKDKIGNISEDVYWGWTLPDRKKAVKKLLENFGGKKLIGFTLGQPKKIMKLEGLRIHRDIPVTAEWFDSKENQRIFMTTPDFLKAVVEIDGGYKIWNMTYE